MVTLSNAGPIWRLELGDDENRMSPQWLDTVEGLLGDLESSTEPAALVTMGQGKFFSNGLDLDWVQANQADFTTYAGRVQQLLARILTLPVPTVAVVNGHAFGAGAMLALAHDFRVMREDRGFFCFPEVDIRIPFTQGMNDLLVSKLTARTALTAMTTGRRYGGADALAAGIVEATGAPEQLGGIAESLVRDLAGKDRTTLATIKQTLFADVVRSLRGE